MNAEELRAVRASYVNTHLEPPRPLPLPLKTLAADFSLGECAWTARDLMYRAVAGTRAVP